MTLYTWQLPDWPNYQFDEDTARLWGEKLRSRTDQITGAMSVLSDDQGTEAQIELMVSAAIETSAIEGEKLNREDVRCSIKNHFLKASERIPVHDPAASGIASLILEVRDRYSKSLTEEELHHWHQLVLPNKLGDGFLSKQPAIGQWRTQAEPIQIVSGAIGKEVVHYEGPPSDRVPQEMERFLEWFNGDSQDLPGIARAAIAHLWFETIHPYEDGNGRIGRAIADKALSQSLGVPFLLSTATTFSFFRKQYYEKLNQASKNTLKVDAWVDWFSACAIKTQSGVDPLWWTSDPLKTIGGQDATKQTPISAGVPATDDRSGSQWAHPCGTGSGV